MRAVIAVVVVVAAGLASLGCQRGSARPPALPRTLNGALERAQSELGCAHLDQVLYVLPTVIQLRGCGQRREFVLVGGRRPMPRSITSIEARASVELACAPGRLEISSPAPAVRAARGCDRHARYDLLCDGERCEWTMTAHTGAWAGIATPVPPQFDREWALPPGVGDPGVDASGRASSVPLDQDLSDLALPPPPGATAPEPAPPSDGDLPIPPPPG
jgi:hypothetical protein